MTPATGFVPSEAVCICRVGSGPRRDFLRMCILGGEDVASRPKKRHSTRGLAPITSAQTSDCTHASSAPSAAVDSRAQRKRESDHTPWVRRTGPATTRPRNHAHPSLLPRNARLTDAASSDTCQTRRASEVRGCGCLDRGRRWRAKAGPLSSVAALHMPLRHAHGVHKKCTRRLRGKGSQLEAYSEPPRHKSHTEQQAYYSMSVPTQSRLPCS